MSNFEQRFLRKLNRLAMSGKILATIDRGDGTDDCFYHVTIVTPSTLSFKDQKLIFWADPQPVWCDPIEEVAATPFVPLKLD